MPGIVHLVKPLELLSIIINKSMHIYLHLLVGSYWARFDLFYIMGYLGGFTNIF